MLVILPPSETKVSGGEEGTALDISLLSFPSQNRGRAALLQHVVELSQNPGEALTALKLGPKGIREIERNAQVMTSPLMPAYERYTGVLYDAVDRTGLSPEALTWLKNNMAIFSALFGLIRATDKIPAYRLSFDSRVGGGKPSQVWVPLAKELWDQVGEFVVDLRSEGYRSLAPVPEGKGVYISLAKPGPQGTRSALGHANKATKGQLVRELAVSGADINSVAELVAWGQDHGYHCDPESYQDVRIDLVISGS